MNRKLCFLVISLVCQVETQSDVGDLCLQDKKLGTCLMLENCRSDGRQWWKYKRCGFIGNDPIVCCPPLPDIVPTTTTTRAPAVTTTPQSSRTTTEYTPETYDYSVNENLERITGVELDEEGCVPLNPSMTAEKTGRKAWDKCIEYQRKLVYPCEPSYALTGGMGRGLHCHHEADQLIVGGVDAGRYEFPHMVLLGFGVTNETEDWSCGGTLISDRYILTAAHCTSQRGQPLLFAIVGSHRRTDNVSSSQVYQITSIHKHRDFNAFTKSNDIALLKTDRSITLDQTVVPACLDVFGGNINQAVATGWGATSFMGSVSDTLQKVTLTRFQERECMTHYPRNGRHNTHYDSHTQVCYGDYMGEKDTCQGDSGGPLTIMNHRVHCMYTVVGVTSIGKMCGYHGVPGYYTKVAPYVTWIEGIVWP